jgi:hypothetical protein
LSVPEIAAELGLSEGDVQEAQFAARRRLAQVAAQRPAKQAGAPPAPSARKLSARPALLAVAAAAVALCVGMPVAATYGQDRHDDSTPALMTPRMADRAL